MLADDLDRPVALGAFGAGVPVAHATVEVEHEDGVIRDALDEVTKPSFAEVAAEVLFAGRCTILALVVARVRGPVGQCVGNQIMLHCDDLVPHAQAS